MIGHKKAAEFFFFGTAVDGKEAEELGLITKAVENEEELEKSAGDALSKANKSLNELASLSGNQVTFQNTIA